MSFGRPIKRPARQGSRDIFVKYQTDGKTIASIGRMTISLLRCHIAGCTKIIDGFHSPFKLHGYSEVSQCDSFVREQEYVAWSDITVHDTIAVGVSKTFKNLDDN